jgi:hypothetical protein
MDGSISLALQAIAILIAIVAAGILRGRSKVYWLVVLGTLAMLALWAVDVVKSVF